MSIPADCIPQGNGERIVEVTSKPDREGKQSFTIYWWGFNPSLNKDSVRAQGFHAVLIKTLALGDRVIDRTKGVQEPPLPVRSLEQLKQSIKNVKFTATGVVSIDLDRAVLDPQYQRIAAQYANVEMTEEVRNVIIQRYIAFYFGREQMFREMPCTNGPGEVYPVMVEVIKNADNGDETANAAV
jgi:hypothetical protein